MLCTRPLALAAAFAFCLVGAHAATVYQSCRDRPRPEAVVGITMRSFSGTVQGMAPGGIIRLRDDILGDIKVVITANTRISNVSGPAGVRSIRLGARLHGYGTFRGGQFSAKVVTID